MKDNSTEMNLKSLEPLYIEGKWDELIDSLNKIKTEIPTQLFHYNMGTALIGRGDVGAGRYHLEKALQGGFYNDLVVNNINAVKQKLPQTYESKSVQYFWKIIEVPKDIYYASSLILIALLLIYIYRNKTIKKLRLFIFLLLISIPSFFAYFVTSQFTHAVSLSEVSVFEGPSKIYKQKGTIVPGVKLVIEKGIDGWFYVKYPEAYAGWVNQEMLGLLDPK